RFFAFSFGEKVAESRMRGHFKLLNFLAFSVQINPSPTTDVVPPLPKRARVFNALISFVNLIV
ncbi:MAG: hypothetical protein ACO3S7_16800, partial [bacterium]